MYGHVMLKPAGKTNVVVLHSESAAEAPVARQAVPKEISASPLYGVAMLKIAMELKKAEARPLEDLIAGVLQKMRIDEGDFRGFLEANGGLLKTIAQNRSL